MNGSGNVADALGSGFDHVVETHRIRRGAATVTIEICIDCELEFDWPVVNPAHYLGLVHKGHYGTCEHPHHPGRNKGA